MSEKTCYNCIYFIDEVGNCQTTEPTGEIVCSLMGLMNQVCKHYDDGDLE